MGITTGSHDASVAVVRNNKIVFASQSERYSRIKNDSDLNYDVLIDACNSVDRIDRIYFYEKPLLKKTRQIYAGQWNEIFNSNVILDFKSIAKDVYIGHNEVLSNIPITYINHHAAHAAQAFACPYNKSIVLVVDAIGEWDTCSIWLYDINNKVKLQKLESVNYPMSLGLMYSAFTQYVGLKPNEDEYIFMGMAAYGEPKYTKYIRTLICNENNEINVNFHKGLPDYIEHDIIFKSINECDLAASIQKILEEEILKLIDKVSQYQIQYNTTNLVYSGGIALNCVINSLIQQKIPNLWIFPNPGDSGCSVGAALYGYNDKIKFDSPYLGYNIRGKYPVEDLLNELLTSGIVGVANGRAEFGPRALGNRSLLANPTIENIKDKINDIKKRQKFRPFAPIILEEQFDSYYYTNGIKASPYMQYVYTAKENNKYTSVMHIDNTSRVQTINKKQHPDLYSLLFRFYQLTGCPMLLNTSLNIKGMPIVNNKYDAKEFEDKYGVRVKTKI